MHSKTYLHILKNKSATVLILCLLLAVWTIAVYWQVLSFDFIAYDDTKYVTENYHIQSGFTSKSLRWALTSLHAGFWQPLIWFSFILDFEIYGLNPAGFHATNLAFHAINAVLLFLFLHLTTQTVWRSWFVAFFFALHPLHVESVAWVAERKDVLSTFFFMLTLLCYYRYIKKHSFFAYGLALALYIFGISSKAMLVSVPFLLLFLDYWPLGRFSFSTVKNIDTRKQFKTPLFLLKEKLPFLIVALFFSFLTIYSQKAGGAVVSQVVHPIGMRIANALTSYLTYIGKLFFPYNLAVLYPFPPSISTAKVLSAAFLLLAITWIVVKMRKDKPFMAVGWFWYTLSIFPVIGVIQVGPQAMADRFTYIPLIGLLIICVWGFYEVTISLSRKKIFIRFSALLLMILYSTLCWKQIPYWKDSFTLFTQALSVTKNNYVAHAVLGGVLSKEGKLNEAEDHFRNSLDIAPGYKTAHIGYGITLAKMQQLQEAEFHFREALKIDPDFAAAHYNLGLILYKKLHVTEAAYHFTQVLKQQPNHPKAHFYLGNILAEQGNMPEAVFHFQEALSMLPHDERILENLKRAETTVRKVD